MILHHNYYQETSLEEDIDHVANYSHPLIYTVLANIIAKYILLLVSGDSPSKRMSYGDYVARTEELKQELLARNKRESVIYGIRYQLEMILDIPATIEVIKDIIENIEKKGSQNGDFHGLDLGSGSGILILAQSLGARRAGWKDSNTVGIEKDHQAQSFSDGIVRRLGVGEVKYGDSTKKEYYPKNTPNFIANENLPTRGIPFQFYREHDGQIFEPFIENINLIGEQYGEDIFQGAGFFPRGISWGSIQDGVSTKVFTARDQYGEKIMRMVCRGKRELSPWIFPEKILIDEESRLLPDVGNKVSSELFRRWDRDFRRWKYTHPDTLTQYQEKQRLRLMRRSTIAES